MFRQTIYENPLCFFQTSSLAFVINLVVFYSLLTSVAFTSLISMQAGCGPVNYPPAQSAQY